MIVYRAGLVISLAGLLCLFYLSTFPTTWSDEAFTLALVRCSYSDIIRLTATDVHPPLYYLLLKLFLAMTKPLLGEVTAAKCFSVLSLVACCGLIAGKGKKMHGRMTAGLMLMTLFAVPQMMAYALEVRMYATAALFVLSGYLRGVQYLRGDHSRKNVRAIVLWTLAASYTHYFACLGMGVLFLWLLIHTLCHRDTIPRKEDSRIFWAAGIAILAYLPWLVVLRRQLSTLSGGYWIEPVTRYTLNLYRQFVFGRRGMDYLLVVLPVLTCLVLWNDALHRRNYRTPLKEALFYASGFMGVLAIGVTVSYVFRPVFVDRYLVPVMMQLFLGILILPGLSVAGRRGWLRVVTVLAACLLALSALYEIPARFRQERQLTALSAPTVSFAQKLTGEDVIITTNRHINEEMAYLSAASCRVLGEEEPDLMRRVFKNAGTLDDASQIETMETEGTIYFLEYNVAPFPDITQALAGVDFVAEKEGELFIEGPVTVYRIAR